MSPYKGSPQGISDLIGGQVQLMFDNLTSISPHVKSGKVRGLGVSNRQRSPVFPEIPTIAEAGVPGYETTAWGGLVVPVGTPQPIVLKLNAEVNRALQSPALRERYAAIDAEPVGGTPAEFAAFVRKETVKWADVVKKSGAKLD
jgi:tripartite-type tricarboxylate transporter receptor subunit TctC